MKTIKVITKEEAFKLIDEESDYPPYRIVNDTGITLIKQWIDRVASKEQVLSAWLTEADDAANNSVNDATIIIEMSGRSTISGNPEILIMDDDCFDWTVSDE